MVAGATASAAAGNLSMGNVSMDQIRLAPNRTSAFMSNWQNDISGNTFSSNMLTGRTAVSLLRNQGYASRVVSMRVSEQDVQDASRQVDPLDREVGRPWEAGIALLPISEDVRAAARPRRQTPRAASRAPPISTPAPRPAAS